MGWEGYGIFWGVIELLRNETTHKMQKHYSSIAYALQTHDEKIKMLVNDFDLFDQDDEFFWSESLLKRMEMKEIKSDKMRSAANKRWGKDEDAKAMQKHSTSNAQAMQLKERKGNENKLNIDSHNDLFRKLWTNKIWLESLAIKWKVDLKAIQDHLNDFRLECIMKDEFKVNEKDAKEHFINWIKRGNPIPDKKAGETTHSKSTIENNWW